MDRDRPGSGPLVQSFSGNGFRVDGVVYATGVKLTPERAMGWHAPLLAALTFDDIADLVSFAPLPEFLLLGTGAELRRPDPALVARVEALGIGIEMMGSRAAARAWGGATRRGSLDRRRAYAARPELKDARGAFRRSRSR